MAMEKSKPSEGAKQQVVFGTPPEKGTAGPDATYIAADLKRWRLRGDGVLGRKKK